MIPFIVMIDFLPDQNGGCNGFLIKLVQFTIYIHEIKQSKYFY